jgi:hypothetical protein
MRGHLYRMSETISLLEAKERLLESSDGKIELLEYFNMGSPAKFKCLICGNEWETEASSIISDGHGCKICSRKNISSHAGIKYTIEEVKKYIISRKCKWVSGEYKNGNSCLNIEFECGHITSIKYARFRGGNGCKICGHLKSGDKQKIFEKELRRTDLFLMNL